MERLVSKTWITFIALAIFIAIPVHSEERTIMGFKISKSFFSWGDDASDKKEEVKVADKKQPPSMWDRIKKKVKTWWKEYVEEPKNENIVQPNTPIEKQKEFLTPTGDTALQKDIADNSEKSQKSVIPVASPELKASTQRIKATVQGVKKANILNSTGGRKAQSGLPVTKGGVPKFRLSTKKKIPIASKGKKKKFKTVVVRVKDIPKLDIGEEPRLERSKWELEDIKFPDVKKFATVKLNSPKFTRTKAFDKKFGAKVSKAKGLKKIKLAALKDEDKISLEMVQKVKYETLPEIPVQEAVVRLMSPEDLKVLRAMILAQDMENCHVTSGLLSEVSKSKSNEYAALANYHLSMCLHEMGLFSESVWRLINVIEKGDPEYQNKAINMLVKDLPTEFEKQVAKAFKKHVKVSDIEEKNLARYYLLLSRAAVKSGKYNEGLNYGLNIQAGSQYYIEGQYLAAVSEYALKRYSESLKRQRGLIAWMEQNKKDDNMIALASLNLARVAFQHKNYKEALIYFSKIGKNHPLWIQALTEQGWAQLLLGDTPGAIGNMYSLHAPFFKSVYKPESFVIRTIGYINYCQYGDAYRTLTSLEKEYRPMMTSMNRFISTNKKSLTYYETLAQYLRSPNTSKNINGLPFQVLREMGRHKDYLNLQNAINSRYDEEEQYKYLLTMIRKDKANTVRTQSQKNKNIKKLKGLLAQAKVKAELAKNVGEWKKELYYEKGWIEFYKFKIEIYKEAEAGLKKFQYVAKKKLKSYRQDLKLQAGKKLKDRLKGMSTELKRMLDNNELLRYEVFAGSGENIRYHLAGGKASEKRIPAGAKPKSEELQWDFSGEYWEDEIGNYRSSIKNNCSRRAASR